jgi:type VI secretion system protein ImpL
MATDREAGRRGRHEIRMTMHFEHTHGSRKGQIETFDLDRVRIGRKADNDLRFDPKTDREVSGYHAEVYHDHGSFFVRDLQSSNGTFLNGRRVEQPTPLADGDTIQFASGGPRVVFSSRDAASDTVLLRADDLRPAARVEEPEPARRPVARPSTDRRPRALVLLVAAGVAGVATLAGFAWWSWWAFFLALVSAVVVLLGALLARWWWVGRRERAAAASAPVEAAREPVAEPRPEGERTSPLRERWAEGLGTLRKSNLQQGGADPVYALPWVLILGESGSGKTTVVQAAHPLPSSVARREAGSRTRNCDWWFFENVVVLDTAGRYTFPAEEAVDVAEWRELLSLLKRSRRREPINGVVVTLTAEGLATRPAERLRDDGAQVRQRLDEVSRTLGISVPVYVLVTGSDAVAGFTDFFAGVPESARGQALGVLNDELDTRAAAAGFLERGFRSMSERLDDLRLALLEENEQEKAASPGNLYLFPEEFKALRPQISGFVDGLFRQNPYHETPLFRGLFFSGGAPERAPLSRLAERMGLPGSSLPSRPRPRSLFARDLFAVVLPQDRALARRTARWSERYQLARLAGIVAVVAVALVLCGLFTLSFVGNSQTLSRLDLDACLKAEPAGPRALATRLQRLDGCRGTVEDLTPRSFWRALALDFGLRQTDRVEVALRQRYLQAFKVEALDPLDARIGQKLSPGPAAPAYVTTLLQRIGLLTSCQESGCPPPEEWKRPNYRVMLSAEYPETSDGDPSVGRLLRTHEAYLRWQPDAAAFERMRADNVKQVSQWIGAGGLRAEWILASASAQFPPVRLNDFWKSDSPRLDAVAQVDPPYTARAWTEGIEPLVSGLREVASEPKEAKESLARFEADYRREGLKQWGQFLAVFPQAEKWMGGRRAGRDLATRVLGPDSPYRRAIEAAASNVQPFAPAGAGAGDLPAWAQTLKRYAALKAKAAEAQKLTPEEQKTKFKDEERQAFRYLGGYAESVDQLRGEVSTPEKGLKSAQRAFEEGAQPAEKSAHPLQRALWNGTSLETAIGSAPGEDRVFWVLVFRPVELTWRVILDQAGLHLQQQWETLWLELTDLTPAQKLGKVLNFVNGPPATFLERRGERYMARTLFGESVAFTPAFLDYLARARQLLKDDPPKLDPPREIVTPL